MSQEMNPDDFDVDWEASERSYARYKSCTHVWIPEFSTLFDAMVKKCYHCQAVRVG